MSRVQVNPTLVIGVGGTGCHVAKMLRKMIEADIDPIDRHRIPMRFIGLDTDHKDLVEVGAYEAPLHLAIELGGPATAVGGKGDNSALGKQFRKWLPVDRAGKMLADPQHLAAAKGAGGKRVLGRYAFKYHVPRMFMAVQKEISSLRDACANELLKWEGIEFVPSDRIEVYVVSSLAGGTGSGAFLDTVAMVHHLIDSTFSGVQYSINLVLVTPSAFEMDAHSQNKPAHKATAYACLKDLDNLLSGAVEPRFEFYPNIEFTVSQPFVSGAYLIGRHGTIKTITQLAEVFRVVAIYLYGMMGTPMGAATDSVANNNSKINERDEQGGAKRYSSIGLSGMDYDLSTKSFRVSSAVARAGALALRYGTHAQPLSEDETEQHADELIAAFKNGARAPYVSQILGTRLADLELGAEHDDATPRDLIDTIETRTAGKLASELSREFEAKAKALWTGNPKEKEPGRKERFRLSALALIEAFGTDGARRILTRADTLLRAAQNDLQNRPRTRSIDTVTSEAKGLLEKIGAFRRLIQPAQAAADRNTAIQAFNDGIEAAVRELACIPYESTVFATDGLLSVLAQALSDIRTANDLLDQAATKLERQASEGSPPTITALDLSLLIYDITRSWSGAGVLDEAKLGPSCAMGFIGAGAGGTGKPEPAELVARLTRVAHRGATAKLSAADVLAAELLTYAEPLTRGDTHEHILDMLIQGYDTTDLEEKLDRALSGGSPLQLVDVTTPMAEPYDATTALVPVSAGHPHAKHELFAQAFARVCGRRRYEQPQTVPFYGPPNRLLLARWILGFALNDKSYKGLPDLRTHYIEARRSLPHVDVDLRWRDVPGPGMEVTGGRKLLWALGLAYGLIAQAPGNRYYNNLKTREVRSESVKGTREQFEVDAAAIMAAIDSKRPAAEWLPLVVNGPCSQTLGRKAVPLATPILDGKPTAKRRSSDLFATGRDNAMASFAQDVAEDYEDVQTGIALILEHYLDSRGKGEVVAELNAYRDRLAAVTTPDPGMTDQLELEVSMINLALDNVAERGGFGLPPVTYAG